MAVCGVCVHGDVQPAARRSVLDYGMTTEVPGRALGGHQTAVVKV